MKKAFLVLALVASSAFGGYADWDDAEREFPMTNNKVDNTNVMVISSKNVNKSCEEASRRRGKGGFGYKLHACSFWDVDKNGNDRCLIIVGPTTSMHTLGHEMMHCLKGSWH